jgi:hypothetical protein
LFLPEPDEPDPERPTNAVMIIAVAIPALRHHISDHNQIPAIPTANA